jgi:hypothetical protein
MEKLQEIFFFHDNTFRAGCARIHPDIKKWIFPAPTITEKAFWGKLLVEELTLNLSDNHSDDEPGYFGYFFVGYGDRNSVTKLQHQKNNGRFEQSISWRIAFVGAKG